MPQKIREGYDLVYSVLADIEYYKHKEPKMLPQLTDADKNRFHLACHEPNLNGCIFWKNSLDRGGYGKFGKGRKGYYRAHRIAYQIAHPEWNGDGLICHTCNNRNCVSHHHLYNGTPTDNARDMIKDGTCRNQKFTLDECAKIREEFNSGDISQTDLAKKYNVNIPIINHIVNNKSYTDEYYARSRVKRKPRMRKQKVPRLPKETESPKKEFVILPVPSMGFALIKITDESDILVGYFNTKEDAEAAALPKS